MDRRSTSSPTQPSRRRIRIASAYAATWSTLAQCRTKMLWEELRIGHITDHQSNHGLPDPVTAPNCLTFLTLSATASRSTHELACGPTSAHELQLLAEENDFYLPIIAIIDAKSVFDSITAPEVQPPADKQLLHSVLKLREWLDRGIVEFIVWLDNRGMLADGLTKGKRAQEDLLKAMNSSEWKSEVPIVMWRSPSNPRTPMIQHKNTKKVHFAL
jgi:hypothetical protein